MPSVPFEEQLRMLINSVSRENTSNTPDFILAEYIESCLHAFEYATQRRDMWYGIKPRPGWQSEPSGVTEVTA